MNTTKQRGVVKWFREDKGYGFIVPDGGGKDIFVHITAVKKARLGTLAEGQALYFVVEQSRGKQVAKDLEVAQ